MTTLNRCEMCNGRKQIAPLGGILKNCPTCQGVGFVQAEIKIIEPALPIIVDPQSSIIIETETAPIVPEITLEESAGALAETLRTAIENRQRKNRYK